MSFLHWGFCLYVCVPVPTLNASFLRFTSNSCFRSNRHVGLIAAVSCTMHRGLLCGKSDLSLLLRKCLLLKTSAVRWNILGSNDLNVRDGRMKRIEREFVVMQEGVEHVL
jgi:hypothetical protein